MKLSSYHKNLLDLFPSLSETDNNLPLLTHIGENPEQWGHKIPKEEKKRVFDYIHQNIVEFEKTLPYPPPKKPRFTFIDLFAGIGGFRQALQDLGGNCVFSSEWDIHAARTYYVNYGVIPFGDIREIDADSIPDHDILCAGFPCQPFSIAGVSKKTSLGQATGFEDEAQGTLFFEIKKILEAKRPPFFLLENVKNILSHDKRKTIKVIKKTFKKLEYEALIDVVDGKNWVPQHRERVFFLGYDKKRFNAIPSSDFFIPKEPKPNYSYLTLDKIIDLSHNNRTLSDGTWEALKRHKAKHTAKNNGFGYKILDYPITPDQVTWTISARYYKDGADCLVPQPGKNPRQLSINEILLLQGFDPNRFTFPGGIGQAYKQLGNSVVIPAIKESAEVLVNLLARYKTGAD